MHAALFCRFAGIYLVLKPSRHYLVLIVDVKFRVNGSFIILWGDRNDYLRATSPRLTGR